MIYFSSLGDALAERLRPQQHQTRFVLEDHHGGPEQSIRVVEEVGSYRVSHLLVDLGWVDFDLGVHPSCPTASAKLPSAQA